MNELSNMPKNKTDRAGIDNADARVAYDTNGWKGPDIDEAQTKADEGGRSRCRKGENNPAQFLTKTAGRPEGLAPGVDFPIDTLKKCQSVHRQTMFVFLVI